MYLLFLATFVTVNWLVSLKVSLECGESTLSDNGEENDMRNINHREKCQHSCEIFFHY